jgi:transposase-like protein
MTLAQHFLLSAQARTLSLRSIFAMGEEGAYATFRKLRWPQTDGAPVCPFCGSLSAYEITTRRRFKCADCGKQYSVTSGTIFHSRKKSFTDLLAAACIIVNGAKGISALQLARDLDCQHKTAFVLAHKIREALASEIETETPDGHVEIDGAYFGGHIRPANRKEDRIDRRAARYQTGERRVVVALRERDSEDRDGRTFTHVRESEAEGVKIAHETVETKATIYADEASHWDALAARWPTRRINHSEAYSDLNGGHTNNVESFFARLRRMVEGQHHGVSARHLHAYAAHAAWLEDHRRMDNGALTYRALGLSLAHGKSATWKGYWQRTAK